MKRNGVRSYFSAGILILAWWTLFPVESVGQMQAASPVGTWEIRTPQASFALELKPDGSGTLNQEAVRWTLNAGVLTLRGSSGTTYMYNAAITPTSLTLSGANLKGPLAFQRVGGGAAPGALEGLAAIGGPPSGSAGSANVVGTWQVPTREGPFTLVLRPDGTGSLPAGEMRWQYDQGVLRITGPGGTLSFSAAVTPTSLTLSGGNFKQPVTFQRAEAGGSPGLAPPPAGISGPPADTRSLGPMGTWETQGRSGPVIMDLRPDGSGTMAGESVRWQFNQGILSIARASGTTHMYNASLTPTTITLSSAGLKQPSVFRRVGAGPSQGALGPTAPTGAAPEATPARGAVASGPVGSWEAQGSKGIVRMTLNPDGAGTFAGESVRWQYNQGILSLAGSDGTTYMYNASLTASSLSISGANLKGPVTFQRSGLGASSGALGAGGGSPSAGGLIGKWQGKTGLTEIRGDGTFVFPGGQGVSYTLEGNVLSLAGTDGVIRFQYSLSGDNLTLTTTSGQTLTFTRVGGGGQY